MSGSLYAIPSALPAAGSPLAVELGVTPAAYCDSLQAAGFNLGDFGNTAAMLGAGAVGTYLGAAGIGGDLAGPVGGVLAGMGAYVAENTDGLPPADDFGSLFGLGSTGFGLGF